MNTNRPFEIGARVVDLHDNHGTVTGYVRDSIGVRWDAGGTSCAPVHFGGLRPEQCTHGMSADLCMDPEGPHHFGTREQEMGWAL